MLEINSLSLGPNAARGTEQSWAGGGLWGGLGSVGGGQVALGVTNLCLPRVTLCCCSPEFTCLHTVFYRCD